MKEAILQQKQGIVEDIKAKFENCQSAILIDYRGLTVEEVTDLRNKFREAGVEYRVLKNTMIRRAVDALGMEGLDSVLEGPTAVAFGMEDAVAPAKIISEFIKKTNKTEIKAGVLEGKVVDVAAVNALASLPSREVLVAKVLGSMNAPITGFVTALSGNIRNLLYVLNAIGEKKSA
ncbi:MAG: 50S ribosomal protein L10 [Christensenellales bacterium]